MLGQSVNRKKKPDMLRRTAPLLRCSGVVGHRWLCGRPLTWQSLDDDSVLLTQVPKPWKTANAVAPDEGALLLKAVQIMPTDTMTRARDLLLDERTRFDYDSDSVDGNPTFELRWAAEGKYTHPGLAAIFQEVIEQRLVPLIRDSPLGRRALGPDDDLVLCEAVSTPSLRPAPNRRSPQQLTMCVAPRREQLVRMYSEGARRVHPAHYDGDALITAVMEIDTRTDGAAGGKGFTGGFYVQPGAHVSSRVPLALTPGDVLAHSFDLQHGVEVRGGTRCSVVLWFTPSAAACAAKSRPWYAAAAAVGDPDALYNLAKDVDRAGDDPRRAQRLMREAAGQGLHVAQNDLAAMLAAGRGTADGLPDMAEAERWWRAAAAQGFFKGMYGLAVLCAQQGGREAEALQWLTRAAEQRADPELLFRLGIAFRDGYGAAARDGARAAAWLREAAQMGHPAAQHALGTMLLHGAAADAPSEATAATARGAAAAREEAERWLRCASDQMHPDAALALGGLYARRGDVRRLGALVAGWAGRLLRASSKASGSARLAAAVATLPLALVACMGAN